MYAIVGTSCISITEKNIFPFPFTVNGICYHFISHSLFSANNPLKLNLNSKFYLVNIYIWFTFGFAKCKPIPFANANGIYIWFKNCHHDHIPFTVKRKRKYSFLRAPRFPRRFPNKWFPNQANKMQQVSQPTSKLDEFYALSAAI